MKRVEALPDVPTFEELGYTAKFYIWAGLFAPNRTPEAIMKKLRDTVRSAVQDADFKSAMTKLEAPIAYLDAPEFQKFWAKDAKMLADAIKRVGKIEEKWISASGRWRLTGLAPGLFSAACEGLVHRTERVWMQGRVVL